ncbi:hypothetical protein MTBBW1_2170009 [Desulfamplus magnetovallimortis]|uniref:Sigma-54 factor interaction domain-containing protein n=1 Tax=Desulfamplus magnetovallimortis TaxID=1246637 RepID=A0A1W1HCX3_9BACT|nr:helix-turn-helix domain-containing protein [Desulfamplus magnetovallimortis]SLM30238.1 hypothetical protein MTBBW1_2170009 [Desulfamplus magnetovallimortis]
MVFIQIPPLRERQKDLETLIGHFLNKCNHSLNKNINTISSNVMEIFHTYRWPGNVRELEHVIEGAMNMVQNNGVIKKEHLSVHINSFGNKNDILSSNNHLSQKNDLFMPNEKNENRDNNKNTYEKSNEKIVSEIIPESIPDHPINLAQLQTENEVRTICQALKDSRGNAAKASRQLGISPQLLHYKMKRYDINRMDYKPAPKNSSE